MTKYQVDIITKGRWRWYLRFHAESDALAHDKLMELAQKRLGRQFQLINLMTNKWMAYACVKQAREKNAG